MAKTNMDKGRATLHELVTQSVAKVNQTLEDGLIDGDQAHEMRDHILHLCGTLGKICDPADQPISFFCIHFICVLMVLCLPLLTMSWHCSLFSMWTQGGGEVQQSTMSKKAITIEAIAGWCPGQWFAKICCPMSICFGTRAGNDDLPHELQLPESKPAGVVPTIAGRSNGASGGRPSSA